MTISHLVLYLLMLSLIATTARSSNRGILWGAYRCPLLIRGGGSSSFSTVEQGSRVYVAVGSNLGDRFHNIVDGIDRLCSADDIHLVRTSSLLETAPMYLTDQPAFLNGIVEVETTLAPKDLLTRIKEVERDLGRDFNGIRNGPRPLDLDIVFYGMEQETSLLLNDEDLVIPHPRIQEREFVLAPLMDLGISQSIHPALNRTIGELFEELEEKSTALRVLPLPRGRMLYFNETVVMGILNVTPDSFSDGGSYQGQVDLAVEVAMKMVEDGAGIIDIGGESTRPGAKETAIEEELQRTIPVIREIRKREYKMYPLDAL
jgi:2-amino-4-hydroxy-6-hydroxymethyldihydropteridine diphosphokinase